MEAITQIELANFERVEPPKIERSNFLYSFTFLPKEERIAINSIYAFCNYIDSIVDCSNNNERSIKIKNQRLNWWEKEIKKIYRGNVTNPVMIAFKRIVERFSIPEQYFMTLIDGCRRDLIQRRYSTFKELKDYCFSVAGIVGLICIEIFGYKYPETQKYAINLGYALQLTNILRDIPADLKRGYIYIPQEDLKRFKYSEEDLRNHVYNDNFIELMRFQTKRAREYFHIARTYLRPDERNSIIAAEIMDAIYYRLLEKIELNEFNVFQKKIKVSNVHKLMIAVKHWLSLKLFVKRIKKHSK